MRALRLAFAAAAVAASFAGTGAAHAWSCNGTMQVGTVCYQINSGGLPTVNPRGSSYDDCVIVASQCVVPIHVPIPTLTPGSGPILQVTCGGPAFDCVVISIP